MIVVNPSTRQFNVPGADLVFGVESDNGSVIKEFQCPRYVGNNLDLAGSFIRINYRNANGEIDSYLVKDVTVDGNNIVFGWELTPKVTRYKGQISFVMCVVGPDTKVKWHTTLGKGQVLEGLEPDNAVVEEGTADVVATLIAMVETQVSAVKAEGSAQIASVRTATQAAQTVAVAEIEAKRVNSLGSIPDDYTAMQNAIRTTANAIRGKASGEVIRVNDVSPIEHYPLVKVRGKNQLSTVEVTMCGKNLVSSEVSKWIGVNPLKNTNGVLSSINTEGASNYMYYDASFPNGEYVASAKFSGYARFLAKLYGPEGRILTNVDVPELSGYNEYYKGFYFSNEISLIKIPDVVAYWQFGVLFSAGPDRWGEDLTISELQLEMSDSVTEYEPYRGVTQNISSDGTATGLKAMSPTMTLLTNTPGVSIECEYSRDTNKVIAEILEKITAIGG